MYFKDKLKDVIELLVNWLSDPQDFVQLEQWIESAQTIADSFEFSEKEQTYVDRIIEMYEEQLKAKINKAGITQGRVSIPVLDELLLRKQLSQRTPEWYAQMATVISASELGKLFGAPRERAKLVLSKTVPYVQRFQPLAVPSDSMSAFDWGIRFEPVVKQIYEHKYGVTIKELGRLSHQVDPRCTASPDGLIYTCPTNERTGRLIEIKCPVTRDIDGSVPKDYYAQMQMQLHVTGLHLCEYVEAVFTSVYNQTSLREGPGQYNGCIAVIRYNEMKGDQEFYYLYSPVNVELDWMPIVDEEVVEIIPWRLHQWSEQLIKKSEEWWVSIQPALDSFWKDVEKAKQGAFTVPDSTRPSKKAKTETCLIQFHKMDENGMEL